ncbi:MAG: hypothetical protein WAL77_13750 [Candidatus Dormiibacterota bacterium]
MPKDEYGLRIDDQVVQFLQLKQKLSYFLITAAVAVIAFVVSFIAANSKTSAGSIAIAPLDAVLVIVGSLAGIVAAGASLLSLHFGHGSFALHLEHRYNHKAYADLDRCDQAAWDRLNNWGRACLLIAFVALFVEILLMVSYFVGFFLMRTTG